MPLGMISQAVFPLIFFIPGLLTSYVLFPRTNIIRRATYAIILSLSILLISGIILYSLKAFTFFNICLAVLIFSFLPLLALKPGSKAGKTSFTNDFWYVLLFSLFGTIWKLWFWIRIKNISDAAAYSFKFIGHNVPDLGFYTGLAADRIAYIGLPVGEALLRFFYLDNRFLNLFLITFLFLGLIYALFDEYRGKTAAFFGVALMAFSPVELFHMLNSIMGHSLAYISILTLFLFFKSKERGIFWLCFILAIVMSFSYYSGSVTMLIASAGFILALFIKESLHPGGTPAEALVRFFKNEKTQAFLLIFLAIIVFIYLFSNMWVFSLKNANTFSNFLDLRFSNAYSDPQFLGLSAIRWQMLFFFFCGATFIWHIARVPKFSDQDKDLMYCLIPVFLISYGFIHVNLPARIFDYLSFAGLLFLQVKKEYFKLFFISAFTFMLLSGAYVLRDKRVFFSVSDKEIEGAGWIKRNLQGKVFSDIFFVNQLVAKGYYNVEGANDKSALVSNLFYGENLPSFLSSLDVLSNKFGVEYVAISKRMRQVYLMMLYPPQAPLRNLPFFESNLRKVYDNGDVAVYKVR